MESVQKLLQEGEGTGRLFWGGDIRDKGGVAGGTLGEKSFAGWSNFVLKMWWFSRRQNLDAPRHRA